MVQVPVRHQYRIEVGGRERKGFIVERFDVPATLKQSAIHKQFEAAEV